MSKVLAGHFSEFAEALEAAAAAARKIEGAYELEKHKSATPTDDGVASDKPVAGGKKGAAAPAVASKPAKPGKTKAPVLTFEDVKAKLTELVESKGKQSVKDLLSEFGAAKLADLEEDNYAEIHAKAVELMAAEAEAGDDDDDMFGD